jgi:hypothetical protein
MDGNRDDADVVDRFYVMQEQAASECGLDLIFDQMNFQIKKDGKVLTFSRDLSEVAGIITGWRLAKKSQEG